MAYADINGIRLHYKVWGEGRPLIFIHGLGSSGRDWWRQKKYFSGNYQLIIPDLRGHGSSSKPEKGYSLPQFANDIIALLRNLNIRDAHLVGISLGGMVAFQIAADAPSLIRSVTAVNSLPEIAIKDMKSKAAFYLRILLSDMLPVKMVALFLGHRLFPKRSQALLRKAFIIRLSKNDRKVYRNSFRAMRNFSVIKRLKDTSLPVLMVSGEHDVIPLRVKKEYASRLPGARICVIKGSRHATPVDAPHEFNGALADFLASI